MKEKYVIVKEGTWKYGDSDKKFLIIKQDHDHYWDEYSNEGPDLNLRGEAYYLISDRMNFNGTRSRTFLSLEEVLIYAETNLPKIKWND